MEERDSQNSSITLSEEWAELSAELCGPEFVKSLGGFFKSNHIRTLLECACGDGHVLRGIARDIERGVGIDTDDYLIQRARGRNQEANLIFKKMDILEMGKNDQLNNKFDAVMLRGNSITAIGAWGTNKETFNAKRCEEMIPVVLMAMWDKLEKGGLLYLDVTKQKDIDNGNETLHLDLGNVHLVGEVAIDVERKRRDAFGYGTVNGKPFRGGSSSYLLGPHELKEILMELLHPEEIWIPGDIHDAVYEVICARK